MRTRRKVGAGAAGRKGAIDDGKRGSIKASFLAKILSPVLGYGSSYELLHFMFDLYMWTMLGRKKNAGTNISMRILLKGMPFFSPEYWKEKHAALLDLQRQLGFPGLFFTIAPYEWSFPYHCWLIDEMDKSLRSRLHLAPGESLHMAHVFVELMKGWFTGFASQTAGRQDRTWKEQLLRTADGQPMVANFFARLEYQDGKRKEGPSSTTGSGRVHMHALGVVQHR